MFFACLIVVLLVQNLESSMHRGAEIRALQAQIQTVQTPAVFAPQAEVKLPPLVIAE